MFLEPTRHEPSARKASGNVRRPALIRSGRAYERTVRGESLLRELQSLLPRLESMVRGQDHDVAPALERGTDARMVPRASAGSRADNLNIGLLVTLEKRA